MDGIYISLEVEMRFSKFSQYAAASVLFALVFAAPTYAQNNKPIIAGTFYEDRASYSNVNTSHLFLTFAQTPTDKFLNVTNVSCNVNVGSTQIINLMDLFVVTGQNDLGRPYSIKGSATSETVNFSKYYSIVTNQIYYKMGPGRYPSIVIDTISSNSSFSIAADCVIVGELKDN